MAERGKFETTEKRIRAAYSKLGMVSMIVGLVALLATVVGVVILLRAEKTEVAAQVLASDELTMYPPEPELTGRFTYGGEEVAHLWKFRVRFVNLGAKTIIGEGNLKNILSEGVNFVFPDDMRILRIEEEADTFQSNIVQLKQNQFQIQFSQWRSDEYTIVSFYIACDKAVHTGPFLTALTRDIIDGEVVIQDLTQERPGEPMFVIDRLPGAISMPGKIIGGFLAGVLAIIVVIVVPWGWKDSLPLMVWKRRHLSNFLNYLDQVEPKLSERRKQMLKKRPDKLPKELWAKFKDPKAPLKTPMFDSVGAGVVTTLVLLVIAFGFISLILMLFPV